MVAQAKAEAPIETCGIMAGKDGVVQKLYKMVNLDQSNDHFTMEPAEQFKVIKAIRAEGYRIQAIYHSHPESPARPSAEDIRLSLTPGVIYVIVSLQDADNAIVKGFLVENGNTTEVPVTIEKG